MIAADTSSYSSFMKGEATPDALLVEQAIKDETLVLSPIVVAELLSSPNMTDGFRSVISDFPQLELKSGFWERVGSNRATILRAGLKARLADTMIATCCLDHGIPLIARDDDFRHFTDHFGLIVRPGKSN
jgi:predicted nucleic acid-binding protein